MRGDSSSSVLNSPAVVGSPSHAWGQPQAGRHEPGHTTPVHPHMRGDSSTPQSATDRVHPHMRGDAIDRPARRRCSGFTPTCVGTAATQMTNSAEAFGGSPPHAWGQLPGRDARRCLHPPGFTPTCVGTALICTVATSSMPAAVHPHMRGDSTFCSSISGHRIPAWVHPHMRGDSESVKPVTTWDHSRPVHPHMRGDSLRPAAQYAAIRLAFGSPPHAWGQHVHDVWHHALLRFTPTCVGTASGKATLYQRSTTVHPHMRGDSNWVKLRTAAPLIRFTPTCVGTAGPSRTFTAHVSSGSPPHAWGQL